MLVLGIELEKLGKRLQEVAAKSVPKEPPTAPSQPN